MSESLFTSQTPSVTDASDGTPGITTATTIRSAVDGSVTAVRFYATATVGGTYTVEVWAPTNDDASPAGTLLASKVMSGSPTGGAWNTVALDTPVSRTAGQPIRAAVHNSEGRYVATTGFFSVDLVNGDLTADADGDDPFLLGAMRQGTFAISATAGAYPSSGSGTSYFVDIVFSSGPPPSDVSGVLAASLGPLTAAAAGTRTIAGTLAAGLGSLTAAMLTAEAAGRSTPIVSQTATRVITSQTRGATL